MQSAMRNYIFYLASVLVIIANVSFSQEKSGWSYDIGLALFKSSLKNQPQELLYNPVFEKWETIYHQIENYDVADYQALEPYPFNLSVGLDGFFRFKKYFMLKVGYYYTNTLGIGGKGHITYIDINNGGIETHESKQISYKSHQLNYYFGPILPVGTEGAEIFMGFSMMSPTFVSYDEKYRKTENGMVVSDDNKHFKGFFGNCRSVIGMQVPISDNWKFGTELVHSYFNGIEMKSGDLKDEGFLFPSMQWNFTLRYGIK